MGKKSSLSAIQRGQIVILHKEGLSDRFLKNYQLIIDSFSEIFV